MSRIFDALQRSAVEQAGVEYSDMVSIATEIFECPRDSVSAQPRAADQERSSDRKFEDASSSDLHELESTNTLSDFPALKISLTAASRLVCATDPSGLAAEKFRFLSVRLRHLRQTRSLKRVLVTSTIPEEGKSLIAANLAGVLAQRKQKVLLVEGDLRRPVLAQRYGLGKLPGLGEWLQSSQHNISNLYRLIGPDYWFMPAGEPPENPLELMQSGRLSDLMTQLAPLFDWIIVDSPPLLPLADTTVWGRVTDGALLVVREGKTEKGPLLRGLEMLKKSDLLGVVLNACSDSTHHNYYQRYAAARTQVKA